MVDADSAAVSTPAASGSSHVAPAALKAIPASNELNSSKSVSRNSLGVQAMKKPNSGGEDEKEHAGNQGEEGDDE